MVAKLILFGNSFQKIVCFRGIIRTYRLLFINNKTTKQTAIITNNVIL